MKKTLGWLAAGVAVGIVVTLIMRPSAPTGSPPESTAAFTATTATVAGQESVQLASRLADVESQLDELSEELRSLRMEAAATETLTTEMRQQADTPEGRARVASMRQFLAVSSRAAPGDDNLVEQLVEGGFSRSRAEEIKRLSDELAMSALEERYEDERGGTDAATAVPVLLPGPNSMLRRELGDTEYEQYLRALGQERPVRIMSVVGNSPAAQAGLRVGDQIVSYGGTRVFDHTEVAPLAAQGTQGEPVVVDILRDGQPTQLMVPRGPLGVSLTPTGLSFSIQ